MLVIGTESFGRTRRTKSRVRLAIQSSIPDSHSLSLSLPSSLSFLLNSLSLSIFLFLIPSLLFTLSLSIFLSSYLHSSRRRLYRHDSLILFQVELCSGRRLRDWPGEGRIRVCCDVVVGTAYTVVVAATMIDRLQLCSSSRVQRTLSRRRAALKT